MEQHKKLIKTLMIIFITAGAICAIFGIFTFNFFTIILGVGLIITGVITKISGSARIDELIKKNQQRDENQDAQNNFDQNKDNQ